MENANVARRLHRIRTRRRAATLLRDFRGPIVVTAGIALTEQIAAQWPTMAEPAQLVLVATAIAGFLTSVSSALLSRAPLRSPSHARSVVSGWSSSSR